jgi:glycosyltransferase involved in cell wall biosynthesis
MNQCNSSIDHLKALITTIEPIDGGVPSMTNWLCTMLEEHNISATLAWYAPWRNYPKLSVPIYRTGTRTPGEIRGRALNNYPSYGFGAWYPEFEFTHYLPSEPWKNLIKSNQLHFVVSGNTLAATPYVYLNVPFVSWIATPWEADRKNRILTFSKKRKFLDSIINKPVLRFLERKILSSPQGTILALSSYTSKELQKISKREVGDVMLMPVDIEIFTRDPLKTVQWRIGFSGRYCDPRKNIDLLLKGAQIVLSKGYDLEIVLVGDKDSRIMEEKLETYGLSSYVSCYQHMNPRELSFLLQTLDIFVIPSHQEGLCISALEAMACGIPVISTRCGGPEEYVIPLKTGYLVDFRPESLASAILEIGSDRELRSQLSERCRKWVEENASKDSSRRIFKKHLYDLAKRNRVDHLLERDTL